MQYLYGDYHVQTPANSFDKWPKLILHNYFN